ncbi:MAG: endonuclease III, partial [Calditrichaeota bacterium]|nr:endonuclease III [Calditrichota bacterium]
MLAEDKRKKVLSILEETYGHTTTALEFKTDFQLLVATIMSAQSTDEQVNKITRPLFTDHPDAAAIAALPLPDLEDKIKRVGLYRNKAKNIHATARILLERYNGEVPRTRE